ncbi:MAG TPA: hypothetical protein VN885_04480 [Candidatus Acidoferrales bacterium]|nr:hypothetical protein [Candidatus Acidoferrales bacterium]
MSSRSLGGQCAASLILILGISAYGWCQAGGPMAPAQDAPASPVPAPAAPSAPAPVPARNSEAAAAASAPASNSSKPAMVEVPGGTHIPLVIHNAISTRSARPGDPVYFETLFPVLIDGKVVIPAGSYMSGEVTEAKRAGRVKGRAELGIKLTTMILPNAYMVNLNAMPSSAGTGGGETVDQEGKVNGDTDKASDAGTVLKTTAAGAGIGGVAAQSGRGAAIGAGIGAAVGLGAVLLSRGPDAELPRGSTVEVVIDRSILLEADKVQFTGPGQASTLPGPPNREPTRAKIPF